ncbi:MAG TPA: hypothetical protein VK790_10165 [Solirubrobacteraceae bacterium]|jgi:hypothetical protein|nr:hypothetical protein [Solirubrobacteraceae bacterium]
MAPRSRTPAEAIEHYRGRTARLLACVTREHVVSACHAADPPHQLELSDLAKLRAPHLLRLKPLRGDWERLIAEAADR